MDLHPPAQVAGAWVGAAYFREERAVYRARQALCFSALLALGATSPRDRRDCGMLACGRNMVGDRV